MKKIVYFLPFIIGFVFYGLILCISSLQSINPFVWIALGILYTSGIMMNKNKWWGCVLGVIIGFLLIYMGTKETGQIIKETSFGIVMCIYYVICGIISYKGTNNKNNN